MNAILVFLDAIADRTITPEERKRILAEIEKEISKLFPTVLWIFFKGPIMFLIEEILSQVERWLNTFLRSQQHATKTPDKLNV